LGWLPYPLIAADNVQLWWFMDRAAQMACIQLPFIVGLAGKNNIISFLTGVSHEKVISPVSCHYSTYLRHDQLNILHRAAGRTFGVLVWIHFGGHSGYVR
jgi:ferric-chelate reductase